jgi:hypothetical protein
MISIFIMAFGESDSVTIPQQVCANVPQLPKQGPIFLGWASIAVPMFELKP